MNYLILKSGNGAKKIARHFSLLMLGALTAFTSCQQDEEFKMGANDAIIAAFHTDPLTRITDAPFFDAGDSVGIYAVKWIDNNTPGQLRSNGNYQDNCLVYKKDDSNWEYVNPIYLPENGESVNLYAYYPYKEQPMNINTTLKVAVRPNQSNLIDYKRSDFSTAVAKGINRDNNNFIYNFSHKLSQIQLQFIPGDRVTLDDLLSAKIKLKGIKMDANYSYGGNSDVITPGSVVTDLVPFGIPRIEENKVIGKKCIIIPQVLGVQSSLEMIIGTRKITQDFVVPEDLKMGESYIMNVIVTLYGFTINIEKAPYWEGEEEQTAPPFSETLNFSNDGGEQEVSINYSGAWRAVIEEVNVQDNPGRDGIWPEKYASMDHQGYMVDAGGTNISGKNATMQGNGNGVLKVGFPKVLFPLVGKEPTMVVRVYKTANRSDVSNALLGTITAKQEKLLPKTVNVLSNYYGKGDPMRGGIEGNWFRAYNLFFRVSSNLFGPSANHTCYVNKSETWEIPSLYNLETVNYLHIGGERLKKHWTPTVYNDVRIFRENNPEAITFYVYDVYTGKISASEGFKNNPFNGDPYTEGTITKAKDFSYNYDTNKKIIKYLVEDGPFGAVSQYELSSVGHMDHAHSNIDRSRFENAGGVTIITERNNTQNVILGINPEDNLIFLGEPEIFGMTGFSVTQGGRLNPDGTFYGISTGGDRFLANFISYVLRCAQYGSHFTDHFKRGSATVYPFAALKTSFPEPMK